MESKKDKQKLTRLVGGPMDGEVTEQKPTSGKIMIFGVGFQANPHAYKISLILDNEGDQIAVEKAKDR